MWQPMPNSIWEKLQQSGVQEAFQGQAPAIDNLHFTDDENLSKLLHIGMFKIVLHDWKKLQSMWKHLNLGYKAV